MLNMKINMFETRLKLKNKLFFQSHLVLSWRAGSLPACTPCCWTISSAEQDTERTVALDAILARRSKSSILISEPVSRFLMKNFWATERGVGGEMRNHVLLYSLLQLCACAQVSCHLDRLKSSCRTYRHGYTRPTGSCSSSSSPSGGL